MKPSRPACLDPSVDALLEALRRAARGGSPRTVLVLHLSRLVRAQPYHGRVARALMTNVAQRLEGEVLRLGTGDLALLCRHAPDFADGPDHPGASGLRAVLTRLFSRTAPAEGPLFSLWQLPADGPALQEFLLSGTEAGPGPGAAEARDPLAIAAALPGLDGLADLVRREVTLRLAGSGAALALTPNAHALGISQAALQARLSAGGAVGSDPMVWRHIATRMSQRMLAALVAEPPGLLLPRSAKSVHLRLSLGAVLAAELGRLAQICRERGQSLLVEIALPEAAGAPDRFQAARARLASLGVGLGLGGIHAESLTLIDLAAIGGVPRPECYRLAWSRALAEAPLCRDVVAALGPERVILTRAGTEAALAFGLGLGIRRFEGRQADALLAAMRLGSCPHAKGCSLAQCQARAAALDPAGRVGCRNPELLDRTAPARVPVTA